MAGRRSLAEEWLDEDKLLCIEGWAREGLTDKQIAENKIGISERAFVNWKKKYPAIYSSLKKGKAPVDIKVENQLLKSALGFTKTVKKPIKVKVEKQKPGVGKIIEEHIEYVEEEIYIPPQPVCMFFWLKNRRPDKWRDRQEQIVTTVEDLTPLAEMLNAEDTDDSMETIFEET